MGMKVLAENVILQAMEDLLCKTNQGECVEFFWGEGFRTMAEAAGMGEEEQEEILKLLEPALYSTWKKRQRPAVKAIRKREAALVN